MAKFSVKDLMNAPEPEPSGECPFYRGVEKEGRQWYVRCALQKGWTSPYDTKSNALSIANSKCLNGDVNSHQCYRICLHFSNEQKRKNDENKKAQTITINTASSVSSVPARSIDRITTEINFYKQLAVQNVIEIGKRLIEAKEQLQHGEWINWLKDSVDFSDRTANNLMKVAREFSNPQAPADLPFTKLLALTQISADQRDDFIASPHVIDGVKKTVDDMTTRELEQAIRGRDLAIKQKNDALEQAKKNKRESDENFKKYMSALATAEKDNESHNHARESWRLDKIRIETELDEIKKGVDGATATPEQLEQIRKIEAKKAQMDWRDKVNSAADENERLKREVDELKSRSAGVMIDPELTIEAADAFNNAIDAAYLQFESIVKYSDPAAVVRSIAPCVRAMRELYDNINKLEASVHNLILLNQEEDNGDYEL